MFLKSASRTTTVQGFILPAITAAEHCTSISRLNVTYRSRAPRHGVCLNKVSMTVSMHGFILPASTAVEKCTLFLDLT